MLPAGIVSRIPDPPGEWRLQAMTNPRYLAWTAALLALALPLAAGAQQLERDVAVVSEDVAGRLEGFSYREGPESKLEFRGTAIALAGDGKGEVEFQDGRARVDVSVRKLPDPWTLGPYSTYVLWAVTADGRANNLGSIELRDGSGSLETSTPLSQFALIVSAEPHFAVTAPSRAVVLRNLGKRIKGEKVIIAGLTERMDYSGLATQSFDPRGRVPLDLVQARYALDIARGAAADRYAPREFAQAEQLLAQAEAAQADKKYSVRKTAPLLSRDAVQMGEDARRKAVLGRQAADTEAAALAARREAEEKAQLEASMALEESRRREKEAAERAASEAAKQARADLTARLNRALPTRETERGIVAEIAGVQFASGAAGLSQEAREALARFAGIVGVYPSLTFKVEGHTDSIGSYETNRALSLQRAISVRDYLVSQGVAASMIDVAGLGPDQPIADNVTAEGRARNRRVEIVLTGDPIAGR
jgi:outer membrane protein OmpA-like peptidoglycan-associated protein